jgi:hypothetical protein
MSYAVRIASLLVLSLGCGAAPAHQSRLEPEAARLQAPSPAAIVQSPEPGAALPETPSRGAIIHATDVVGADVRACGRGVPGEVSVHLVFDSSGAVTDASIRPTYSWGAWQPGPDCDPRPEPDGHYGCQRARPPVPDLDDCILRAVRATRLPPFTQPSFSVNFPFRY